MCLLYQESMLCHHMLRNQNMAHLSITHCHILLNESMCLHFDTISDHMVGNQKVAPGLDLSTISNRGGHRPEFASLQSRNQHSQGQQQIGGASGSTTAQGQMERNPLRVQRSIQQQLVGDPSSMVTRRGPEPQHHINAAHPPPPPSFVCTHPECDARFERDF